MTGPIRTKSTEPKQNVKAPRPPNSWIIYRSDKMHELMGDKSKHSGSRKGGVTQADISKIISEMWKNESEAVRSEYDRRAEIKKAEHYAKFPNYRFQPVKKEDKARERAVTHARVEERSQRRVKPTIPSPPTSAPSTPRPPVSRVPSITIGRHRNDIAAEGRYGPSGPSPPISAASTPYSSPKCPSRISSPVHHPAFPQPPQLYPSAASSPSDHPTPTSELRLPSPVESEQHNFWQNPDPQNYNGFIPVSDHELQNWNFGTDMQFLGQIGNGSTQSFDVGTTLDPGMLTLTPHNPSGSIFEFPQGDLQFQMGIIPQSQPEMFAIDWASYNFLMPSPAPSADSPLTPQELHAPAPLSATATLPPQWEPEYYLPEPSTSSQSPPAQPSISPPAHPPSQKYSPPSGAKNSHFRRAGGTWKPPTSSSRRASRAYISPPPTS